MGPLGGAPRNPNRSKGKSNFKDPGPELGAQGVVMNTIEIINRNIEF